MFLWESFELDCCKHLNEVFSHLAQFKRNGGSNAYTSDIKVTPVSGADCFYIEAKKLPAQAGQFVLKAVASDRLFEYSSKNHHSLNENSRKIISYMNSNFKEFESAGTAGREIDIKDGQKLYASWIKDYYKSKNVKFIITSDYILIPIDALEDFVNIKSVYRVKKSGSSKVGVSNSGTVCRYLNNSGIAINSLVVRDGKVMVDSDVDLHNTRFKLNNQEYMISARELGFEVRRLSNTFNANVIFSLQRKLIGADTANMLLQQFVSSFNS